MTLIALSPGVAAHLALAARRYVASWEATPNLDVAGRCETEHLRALVDQLDGVVKAGQFAHLLAVTADDGAGNLQLAEAASVAQVSVATLRRRLREGVLPKRYDGHRVVIPAAALTQWIERGKPRGRAA